MISSLDKEDENSLLTTKDKIIQMGIKLDSTNKIIREIEDKLNQIDKEERTVGNLLFETREEATLAKDKEERTVGNLLFETREEATLAKEDKEKLEEIITGLDVENEKSLMKAKKQIESSSFKTKIVDTYINKINQHIQNIHSETIDEAEEYEENKESFKSMLLGSIVIFPLGIYFFGRVGTLLKIVIGIFLLGAVGAVFEELKKVRKSKKAIKQLKKLQKSGRI